MNYEEKFAIAKVDRYPEKPQSVVVTNWDKEIENQKLARYKHEQLNTNSLCGEVLEKGKYDINYTIKVLKIILHHKPEFGMAESIRRLLAMLEVERDNV